MEDDLLYAMLEELGSVSAVYYRPATEFIHPVCGPSPVQTNSPLPDEEIGIIEDTDSSESEEIDIFADEPDNSKQEIVCDSEEDINIFE